jgi:hypothetical protein
MHQPFKPIVDFDPEADYRLAESVTCPTGIGKGRRGKKWDGKTNGLESYSSNQTRTAAQIGT